MYCNIGGVRNLGAKECTTPWYVIIDMDTIIDSVKRTNRLVILEESWPYGNISTEISNISKRFYR